MDTDVTLRMDARRRFHMSSKQQNNTIIKESTLKDRGRLQHQQDALLIEELLLLYQPQTSRN
jgi:hypothetical protein